MKTKLMATTVAALAIAAALQTAAKAEDPISPLPGAVCNLYLIDPPNNGSKTFNEIAASLPSQPAAATFVDAAAEFKPSMKKENIASQFGMWTGWFKQEKAGTYTFTCQRGWYSQGYYRYSIWINGRKCAEAAEGQYSFNVDLNAGFNSIKIIVGSGNHQRNYPLTITYKKAGSVREPDSFGPENMYYDDED
jgi:hypothetical protein